MEKEHLGNLKIVLNSIDHFLSGPKGPGLEDFLNTAEKLRHAKIYHLDNKNVPEVADMINKNKVVNPIYIKKYNLLIDCSEIYHTLIIKLFDHLGLIELDLSDEDRKRNIETDAFTVKNFGWFMTSADPSAYGKESITAGDNYRFSHLEEALVGLLK